MVPAFFMSRLENLKTRWSRRRSANRWAACISHAIQFGIFVSVAAGSYAAVKNIALLRQSVDAARSATQAARASADAAVRSNDLAELSVRQSLEAYRLDRRAWIGIDLAGPHPDTWVFKAGQPVQVSLWFRNTGATLARELSSNSNHLRVPAGTTPPGFVYADSPEETGAMMPNATAIVAASRQDVLTEAEDRAWAEGKMWLYYFGYFLYEDIFERSHATTFCYVLRSQNSRISVDQCQFYNYAD